MKSPRTALMLLLLAPAGLRARESEYLAAVRTFADTVPHLDAAMGGHAAALPVVWPTRSYFHCPYDGKGRTCDNSAIYSQTRP